MHALAQLPPPRLPPGAAPGTWWRAAAPAGPAPCVTLVVLNSAANSAGNSAVNGAANVAPNSCQSSGFQSEGTYDLALVGEVVVLAGCVSSAAPLSGASLEVCLRLADAGAGAGAAVVGGAAPAPALPLADCVAGASLEVGGAVVPLGADGRAVAPLHALPAGGAAEFRVVLQPRAAGRVSVAASVIIGVLPAGSMVASASR